MYQLIIKLLIKKLIYQVSTNFQYNLLLKDVLFIIYTLVLIKFIRDITLHY